MLTFPIFPVAVSCVVEPAHVYSPVISFGFTSTLPVHHGFSFPPIPLMPWMVPCATWIPTSPPSVNVMSALGAVAPEVPNPAAVVA